MSHYDLNAALFDVCATMESKSKVQDHEDKTTNGQLESRASREATRCESVTGGGRYQCCLVAGHAGRHRADAGFTSWSDDA